MEVKKLFIDFSIHRGKMKQIILVHGLFKETVIALMMLYKNTKAMVNSLDGDTDFFNIVAEFLHGNTLAPYLFIICLDYVLRMSIKLIKDNNFLNNARSRWYPAETMTEANYANDQALLANTQAQAGCIGLFVNETEFTCFKKEDISNLSGKNLKLIDQFIYFGSITSSTENDASIQ